MFIPLNQRLVYLVQRAQCILNVAYHHALAPFAATAHHYSVLALLAERNDLTAVRMAEILIAPASTISLVVNDFLKRRLITTRTNPDDRRQHFLRITPKGRAELNRMTARALQVRQRILAHMTEEEAETLIHLLGKFTRTPPFS